MLDLGAYTVEISAVNSTGLGPLSKRGTHHRCPLLHQDGMRGRGMADT